MGDRVLVSVPLHCFYPAGGSTTPVVESLGPMQGRSHPTRLESWTKECSMRASVGGASPGA